jgi:TonB family protein
LLRNPDPQLKEVTSVMSNPLAQAHDHLQVPDRRVHSRLPIRSLAYVELDEGNGGIVLNVSEGGLSVQAFASLMDDVLPGVRFQLSESEGWIQAHARITWTGESRKLAGLEFVDLAEDDRSRLKEWLAREAVPPRDVSATGTISKEDKPPAPAPEASEAAASIAPAANDHDLDETATAELGIDMAPAPVPAAEPYPIADAFARILGQARESEPPQSDQSVEAKPISAEKLIANRWAAAAVLALLAVASLAAGWVAGQGQLRKLLGKFYVTGSRAGADVRETASNSTSPVAQISDIEVVSATNQRWTIPFNGPLNSPEDVARRQAYGNTSSEVHKPQSAFRTWILTPPQQTRAVADDGRLAKENPPVLADTPTATEGALTSSGAINSHALAGSPSLRVPDPPPPTEIVKQGQLIRRFDPEYPMIARDQHAEGTVRLNVTIGPDGVVRGIAVLGGPRLLVEAAESAVRQWRYTPTTLDGKPVEFQREVDLTFHLSNASH